MPFDNITKTAIFTYCTRDLPNNDWYENQTAIQTSTPGSDWSNRK